MTGVQTCALPIYRKIGRALFEYVQLFVISNGTLTKYYSNTTRSQHLKEGQQASRGAERSARTGVAARGDSDATSPKLAERRQRRAGVTDSEVNRRRELNGM